MKKLRYLALLLLFPFTASTQNAENDDFSCVQVNLEQAKIFKNDQQITNTVLNFNCLNNYKFQLRVNLNNCTKLAVGCGYEIAFKDLKANPSALPIQTNFVSDKQLPHDVNLFFNGFDTTNNDIRVSVQLTEGYLDLVGKFIPKGAPKDVGAVVLKNTGSTGLDYDYTKKSVSQDVHYGSTFLWAGTSDESPKLYYGACKPLKIYHKCVNNVDNINAESIDIMAAIGLSLDEIIEFTSDPVVTVDGNFSKDYDFISQTGATNCSIFELPANMQPGTCALPRFRRIYHITYLNRYKSNCDGDDILVRTDKMYLLHDIQLVGAEISNGNPPVNTNSFSSGSYQAYRQRCTDDFGNICCKWAINLNLASYYTGDPKKLNINWEGPNAYVSEGKIIDNLDLGSYTFTLTDAFCETFSQTITLCDADIEIGDWVKNQTTGNYCRKLICDDSPNCENTECVAPDIVSTFQANACYETPYYNGLPLGPANYVGLPETQISYQISEDICLKKIRCGGSVVEEMTEGPEWDYDNGKCIVICFGEEIEAEDIEPEIEEEFNEFWFECTRVITCNDVEVVDEEYDPEEEDWEFDDWRFECVKLVSCGENSDDFEVTVDAEVDEWEYDDWRQECFTEIICNDEDTGITYTVDAEFEDWEYDDWRDECVASIYCENEDADIEYRDDPEGYGNWHFSTGNNECWREVECEYTFETFKQYVDFWTDYNYNIDCPSSSDIPHPVVFYCGNDEVAEEDCLGQLHLVDRAIISKEKKSKIVLNPNPLTDYLRISGLNTVKEPCRLAFINSLGQTVKSIHIVHAKVDIYDLPTGMYTVAVYTERGRIHVEQMMKL